MWLLCLPSNTFAPFHRCWAQFWHCDRWETQKPYRVRSWPVPLHVFSNHCGHVHVILSRLWLNFILILPKFYTGQNCTQDFVKSYFVILTCSHFTIFFGVEKFSWLRFSVYVVKSPVLGLQRAFFRKIRDFLKSENFSKSIL